MKKNYLKRFCFIFFFAIIGLKTYAQTGNISGKVVDETNGPLPGATVSVEGTKFSTQTDMNGFYRLNGILYGNVSVKVKFIGYTDVTKSVIIKSETLTLNFNLVPSSESLNEVVVIGYGTARKTDVTGAITTVSTKDFTKGQITSPEQLIAGKVAGVQITQGAGDPGSSSNILIRGGASLNSTNYPLIVVDGVPLAQGGISGSPNALALINPNDIETFTVLKDASATAIYGNRGSNGVIIITTKKGELGKPQFTFGSSFSYQTIANTSDILSASQFKTLVTEAPIGGTITNALKATMGTSSTNWQNEIFENAATTENNVSISGSIKKLPYRFSAGYLNQDGILKTGNLERLTLAGNLNPSFLNNTLKLNLNVKHSMSKSIFADWTAISNSISFDPTQPVLSGNSNYGGYFEFLDATSTNGLRGLAPKNPLAYLNLKDNTSDVNRTIGNFTVDYAIPHIKGLRLNANVGYDIANGSGNIVVLPTASYEYQRFNDSNGIARSGENNQYKQRKSNFVSDAYLNYIKEIKSIKSRIDLTGGTAYQKFVTEDYSYADYSYDNVKKPNSDPNFTYNKPENRLFSMYGRLIYTFNDKYVLTTTVRSDASSKFSAVNRTAIFPSAALAWRISEEKILKSSKIISDLKLRLGYGVTGQQDGISNYSYLANYSLSNATAQYQLGNTFYNMYRPEGYNPNLKWESTATTNIGLDYGILKNRIYGTLDFYYKETSDLLSTVTQPAGTNFTNEFTTNVGSMTNKGVELMINTVAVDKKDFKLNFGFNVTYNKNEITKLTVNPDPNYIGYKIGSISGGTGNTIQINSVGSPRNAFYVYQQVYDANGKPLDNVFVDRNDDGQISDKDLYKYKSPNADVFLGFSSNFTYKNWSGGFTMRANLNNYVYDNVSSSKGTYRNIFNPLGYLNNGSTDILNTGFSGDGDKYFLSDYYIKNASFLRMDNANVGYSFGKILNGKANLNINGSIQNVFVITNYKGVDPEIDGGIDNVFYPRPRTFTLGLNLGF
jgi:TonB-dependent starch-binding outer membrane protein SusC